MTLIQPIVAGLSTRKAFDMGVGFLGVGFLETTLSCFLPVYFGRRTIYNSSLGLLAVLQIVIGILDCAKLHPPSQRYLDSIVRHGNLELLLRPGKS
jgi:hypothetical protein